MKTNHAYTARAREVADGFEVDIPDIPDVVAKGATLEEALAEATIQLEAELADYAAEGHPIPIASTFHHVIVRVGQDDPDPAIEPFEAADEPSVRSTEEIGRGPDEAEGQ